MISAAKPPLSPTCSTGPHERSEPAHHLRASLVNIVATEPGGARSLAPAALACMGVVFGDIGTSPLYTLNVAAKSASPDGQVSPEAVVGIVSLIFWSLIIVISIKYAILIMRADNHGEGGILALLALVSPRRAKRNKWRAAMVVIGLIGATLLYGDGTITPAISVLSAIEGLKIYAPQMGRAVVPLTVAILVILFLIQRNGTSFIGGIFGPVMLIWFIVAGVLGVMGIVRTPAILTALSPLPAVTYFWHAGPLALVVISGAFPGGDRRRGVRTTAGAAIESVAKLAARSNTTTFFTRVNCSRRPGRWPHCTVRLLAYAWAIAEALRSAPKWRPRASPAPHERRLRLPVCGRRQAGLAPSRVHRSELGGAGHNFSSR
jgi:hypothetical protein